VDPAGAVAVLALLALAVPLLALVGRPLATDDTWWHLAMGALYSAEGLAPQNDPLLFTTGARVPVPHEWLFQVAIHHVKGLAGFAGLRVVHVAAVAGILVCVAATFRRAGASLGVAAVGTLVFTSLSWFRLIQLRPDLVSVAAVLGVYALLLQGDGPPSWRRVGAALLLLALWANAHSVFAVGVALLLAALLGALLWAALVRAVPGSREQPARQRNAALARRLTAALGLAVVVTALNPRGFDQHLTFFAEADAGAIWQLRDDFLRYDPLRPVWGNAAFSPLSWGLYDALLIAFAASALAAGLAFAHRRSLAALRVLDPVHLGLGAAAIVASIVAVRFHWLSVFPLLYLIRRHGAAIARSRLAVWALAAAGVALAVVMPRANGFAAFAAEVAREERGYRAPWMDRRYCGSGARFLEDARLEGHLYNPFNLGGFLGYRVAPRLRTFIDGRLDHVPPLVLDDYRTLRRASLVGPTQRLRDLLDRWQVDLFFADAFPESEYPGRQSGFHLRRQPDWIPVYASGTHAIYVRKHERNRRNLDRVAAYYREREIPFDRERGLDVGRVLRAWPASPPWRRWLPTPGGSATTRRRWAWTRDFWRPCPKPTSRAGAGSTACCTSIGTARPCARPASSSATTPTLPRPPTSSKRPATRCGEHVRDGGVGSGRRVRSSNGDVGQEVQLLGRARLCAASTFDTAPGVAARCGEAPMHVGK
jgi:hypothetical protein